MQGNGRLSPAPKSATKSVKKWACLLTKLPPFSGSSQVLRHNTGLTVQRRWAAFWRKPGTCGWQSLQARDTRPSEGHPCGGKRFSKSGGKSGGHTRRTAVTSTKELYATGQDRTR